MSGISPVSSSYLAYTPPLNDTNPLTSEENTEAKTTDVPNDNTGSRRLEKMALESSGNKQHKNISYAYEVDGKVKAVELKYDYKTRLYTGKLGDLTITSEGLINGKNQNIAIKLGTITVKSTTDKSTGTRFEGSINRPLDPTKGITSGNNVNIQFEYYPPSDGTAKAAPILMENGGPGYSSTGARKGFLDLADKARATHGILLIDSRGTGKSTSLKSTSPECSALQNAQGYPLNKVKACLNTEDAKAKGQFYSTENTVGDIIGVLKQANIGSFHYYGVSYGTYLGQTLVDRLEHPQSSDGPNSNKLANGDIIKIKSKIYDGAYQVGGADATALNHDTESLKSIYKKIDDDPVNKGKFKETFEVQLRNTVNKMRNEKNPPTITYTDAGGKTVTVNKRVAQLYNVLSNGNGGNTVTRDIRAALYAYEKGDEKPLDRLIEESEKTTDPSNEKNDERTKDPKYFNKMTAVLVSAGYPQDYNPDSSPQKRQEELNSKITEFRSSEKLGPFTLDEAMGSGMGENIVGLDVYVPGKTKPVTLRGISYSPTYFFNGTADVITPGNELGCEDGKQCKPDKGSVLYSNPKSKIINFNGAGHGAGLTNLNSVGSNLFGQIINYHDGEGNAEVLSDKVLGDNVSEANNLPSTRTLGRYAINSSELSPVKKAGTRQQTIDKASGQVLSAVGATISDAVTRLDLLEYDAVKPLRGGTITIKKDEKDEEKNIITLKDVKWTGDVIVNGTIIVSTDPKTGKKNVIADNVTFKTTDGFIHGQIKMTWNDYTRYQPATIEGSVKNDRSFINNRYVINNGPAIKFKTNVNTDPKFMPDTKPNSNNRLTS